MGINNAPLPILSAELIFPPRAIPDQGELLKQSLVLMFFVVVGDLSPSRLATPCKQG
jgi:hypothetical protein